MQSGILYHLKTAQNRRKMFPKSILVNGLPDIVLHPDYAKKMVGFIPPKLPR
jgi:hypothetical protein